MVRWLTLGCSDSWCIQKVNECCQPNPQMHAFISNLEVITSQVHAMDGVVTAATGGTAPLAFPSLTYEEHMSNIHEHSIAIDTECATVTAEKKHVQVIQKAKHKHVEVSNANTSSSGSGHGNTGRGNDTNGQNATNQGHGRGCNNSGHDSSTGRGSEGQSTSIPPALFQSLTQEQWALLFQA